MEKIIVSLTSWPPRFSNVPLVLDSIFSQTIRPDLVVLNISQGDVIPEFLKNYIEVHGIELNFVRDTKVYKKLIPTLAKHPEAIVISIDDDFIYPEGMIEDFVATHRTCPDSPISGNRVHYRGLKCHCGCASMMKKDWLGRFVEKFDQTLINNCPSDDLVYTFFAKKNGFEYIETKGEYFYNMMPCNPQESYSSDQANEAIIKTWGYLALHYGTLEERVREIGRRVKNRILKFG